MPCCSPESIAPWMAAPIATHSSGLMPFVGSLPMSSFTSVCTIGMRVEPPTSRILCICEASSPASLRAVRTGVFVLSRRSLVSSSNFARVSFCSRCFGPLASAVMNGSDIVVSCIEESSIFAFSAASRRRCAAILSFRRSMPSLFLNSAASHSTILLSQSSPPSLLSPAVERTSKTPSPTSSIETSNVPPPRS